MKNEVKTDHEIQCPFCGHRDSIEKINELGGYLGDPEYDNDFYDNIEYNESYRVQCNKCKKEFHFELIGNVMQFKSYYNK